MASVSKLFIVREHVVGTGVEADWVDGLVVALDYLRRETEGKKYTTLKIVIFRECAHDLIHQ